MLFTFTSTKIVKYVFFLKLKNIYIYFYLNTFILFLFIFLVRKHITSEELEKLLDVQENNIFVDNVRIKNLFIILIFLRLK